jgi:hypothetical protein
MRLRTTLATFVRSFRTFFIILIFTLFLFSKNYEGFHCSLYNFYSLIHRYGRSFSSFLAECESILMYSNSFFYNSYFHFISCFQRIRNGFHCSLYKFYLLLLGMVDHFPPFSPSVKAYWCIQILYLFSSLNFKSLSYGCILSVV